MMDQITAEEIEEYIEELSLLGNENGDEKITVKELSLVAQSLDENLIETEELQDVNEVGVDAEEVEEAPPLDVDVEIDGFLKGIWLTPVGDEDGVDSRPLDVDVEIDGALKGIWPLPEDVDELDQITVKVELGGMLKELQDPYYTEEELANMSQYSMRALDVDVEMDADLKGFWINPLPSDSNNDKSISI